MLATLGPIALGIAAVAATVESVRVLHDEFFAGNRVLEEYLDNLRDAQTELDSAAAQNREGGSTGPEDNPVIQDLEVQRQFYENTVREERGATTKFFDFLRGQNASNIEGAFEFLTAAERGTATLEDAQRVLRDSGRI